MANDKQITLDNFKMWLSGVEEMQIPDWFPTETQWKKIREKIDTIVDSGSVIKPQPPILYRESQPTQREQEQPVPPRYEGPVQFAPGGLSHVAAAPPSNNALFGNADIPGSTVRTPNLDTSNGTYEPAFL
jgi:hypothetical protein